MKKTISWLKLFLIFSIITPAFYFFLVAVYKNKGDGFGGIAETILYLILWGHVFIYVLTRKLTIQRPSSVRISLLITLLLLGITIVSICFEAGIIG